MASQEKLIALAGEHLEKQEPIIAVVRGAYETKVMGNDSARQGIFLATDRRVVFFAKKLVGYDLETFPYSNISSIEMSKGILGHSITFFASGNRAHMKWIKGDDVAVFAETVRTRIGKRVEAGPVAGTMDITEQITKLAALRDSGLLTEEEFAAKKTDLLAKM